MKVGFVINNRRDGRGHRAKAEKLAGELGIAAEYRMTERSGHAIELAWGLTDLGCDVIVAVGGDGTVNEVVNGIMRGARARKAEELPAMAIITAGTGNDFSRPIQGSGGWGRLKAALQKPLYLPVDLGKVQYTSLIGAASNRWFINIGEVGMGAAVVARLNRWRNNPILPASYNLSILATFMSYKHLPVTVEGDDWKWNGHVMAVIAANSSDFGRGLRIAPDAVIDDGKFQVVVVGAVSVMDYLRQLNNIKAGKRLNHPHFHYFESTHLKVLPASITALAEADGELLGKGPFEFTLHPSRLRILAAPPRETNL